VRDTSRGPHARLKQTWLRVLQAGTGSFVVAVAVVAAPPVQAARLDPALSVSGRVQEARDALRKGLPPGETDHPSLEQLAWWGNRWGNGWGHPAWHNWPNWHNWHNWHNWSNW